MVAVIIVVVAVLLVLGLVSWGLYPTVLEVLDRNSFRKNLDTLHASIAEKNSRIDAEYAALSQLYQAINPELDARSRQELNAPMRTLIDTLNQHNTQHNAIMQVPVPNDITEMRNTLATLRDVERSADSTLRTITGVQFQLRQWQNRIKKLDQDLAGAKNNGGQTKQQVRVYGLSDASLTTISVIIERAQTSFQLAAASRRNKAYAEAESYLQRMNQQLSYAVESAKSLATLEKRIADATAKVSAIAKRGFSVTPASNTLKTAVNSLTVVRGLIEHDAEAKARTDAETTISEDLQRAIRLAEAEVAQFTKLSQQVKAFAAALKSAQAQDFQQLQKGLNQVRKVCLRKNYQPIEVALQNAVQTFQEANEALPILESQVRIQNWQEVTQTLALHEPRIVKAQTNIREAQRQLQQLSQLYNDTLAMLKQNQTVIDAMWGFMLDYVYVYPPQLLATLTALENHIGAMVAAEKKVDVHKFSQDAKADTATLHELQASVKKLFQQVHGNKRVQVRA